MNFAIDPGLAWMVRLMEDLIPFDRYLGMRVVHAMPGEVVLRIPWADHLIGDPSRPAVHGGVLSTLLDTVGGAAVFSRFDGHDDRCSTVDLRVDYLRPGPAEDLYGHARVIRLGNRVGVSRMEVYAGGVPADPAEAIATGTGVYNIVRRGESA